MRAFYNKWMDRWETSLAHRDTNRVTRPFEWGLEWLVEPWSNGASASSPRERLAAYSEHAARDSAAFFAHTRRPGSLSGSTLSFPSPVETPHPENNTVYAEYFPAERAQGRAVLVIPQWNADEGSHLGLCRLLNRAGLSALRLSKAYHHRRKPAELQRADYHVSSNLGRTIHATRQSVLDARCCLDWLESRGYDRLAVLGTSLGSCIALLAVAHDPRVKAAVFNHVSAYFADVVWTGLSCRHIRASLNEQVTQAELRQYWSVISPATHLHRLQGRDLDPLLIWATLDSTFLPEYSREALQGFRDHRIPHREFAIPCGHYTLAKFPFNWIDGLAIARSLRDRL